MKLQNNQPWVLVRGAGDLATGVIVRLHRCGFKVMVTECANPSAIRRKAALCEAVWQGAAQVEGVTARRVADAAQTEKASQLGEIPLLVDENAACITTLQPAAVVDAILAKRNLGTSREMAPITVGLGVCCRAGRGRGGRDHARAPAGARDPAGSGDPEHGCAGCDRGLCG